MKRFLWVLAVLIIAVVLGVALINLPGYVLIQISHGSVAMPLWLAGLGILFSFLLLFILYRLWAMVMVVPGMIKRYKQRRSMQGLQNALDSLLSTDWLKAELHFKRLARAQFLLPYTQLMAANCAAKSGRIEAQEAYVKLARPILARDALLIELGKLDILIAAENFQGLITQIQKLKVQYPSNPGLLRREILALQQLKAWPQIVELLAESKQNALFSEAEYEKMASEAYAMNLTRAIRYAPQTVDELWAAIPEQFHSHLNVATAYIRHLLKAQQADLAEAVLQKALEHHAANAESLALIAQVSLSKRDYIHARQNAELSLSSRPNAAAYSVLAQIYEHAGDMPKAMQAYKQAAGLL
ncbi:MAG: heme biosynthesis HemY N-terminal domain-containing protein [Gammaproteobacteria bacterium]|nr:heme biosynthesis HemY N-terminal domain-containing protein [Gammaproteobacteria bacterium]